MVAPTPLSTPADVAAFWLEAGPALWFAKDDAFDERMRRTFQATQAAAARGEFDDWQATGEGALALILLLDQFPRNLYRGSAQAFATDRHALGVAHCAVERGFDKGYAVPMRRFFYLPMMHSEHLADQDFCVAMCAASDDREGVAFANLHRDIIQRFGRFPHRNAALGRPTTPEEQAFLNEGGFSG